MASVAESAEKLQTKFTGVEELLDEVKDEKQCRSGAKQDLTYTAEEVKEEKESTVHSSKLASLAHMLNISIEDNSDLFEAIKSGITQLKEETAVVKKELLHSFKRVKAEEYKNEKLKSVMDTERYKNKVKIRHLTFEHHMGEIDMDFKKMQDRSKINHSENKMFLLYCEIVGLRRENERLRSKKRGIVSRVCVWFRRHRNRQ